MQKLAVVGLGQMGLGIAQVAAQSGLQVLGFDANPQAYEKAKSSWEKIFSKKMSLRF
jgi:3-hydroxybutyryl-CoA dehydrogenase